MFARRDAHAGVQGETVDLGTQRSASVSGGAGDCFGGDADTIDAAGDFGTEGAPALHGGGGDERQQRGLFVALGGSIEQAAPV